MIIQTKFNVNDLIVSKYQRNPISQTSEIESVYCFEIIDINTGTCMAGTQVFYVCRSIHGILSIDYIDGKKVKSYKDFLIGSGAKGEYTTLREDEIVVAPKEVIDLVLGKI